MEKLTVIANLQELREARKKWYDARANFFSGYEQVLTRLVHEGVANYMSPNEIAAHLGVGVKSIRTKMRNVGLDPRSGKRVLNMRASQALLENSAIMGIEPRDMDLTSPLAYLPMGETLRQQYRDRAVSRVTEIPDEDARLANQNALEDRLYRAIVSRFEGMGEAWTTDNSGDTLARAAAEEAARLVSGNGA